MKNKSAGYIYIAPTIVGSPSNYSYSYDTDHEVHSTPKKARKALWRAIDSDDGWVAEVDRNGKVLALFNASEDPLHDKREDQEEIDDINREWGLL